MKKASPKKSLAVRDMDMKPEYNFRGAKGVRGRYAQALREGYSVRIYEEDGTYTEKQYKPDQGVIFLAPDVQKYFPDSDAVNEALRCLIPLVSKQVKRRKMNAKA
jgi:hypothetical protein